MIKGREILSCGFLGKIGVYVPFAGLFHMACDHFCTGGFGRGVVVPIIEIVDTARKICDAPVQGRSHVGRHTEKSEPNSWPVGRIRERAVHKPFVVYRELACLQLEINGA